MDFVAGGVHTDAAREEWERLPGVSAHVLHWIRHKVWFKMKEHKIEHDVRNAASVSLGSHGFVQEMFDFLDSKIQELVKCKAVVKLPKGIRNLEPDAYKACGHTFRQYLDRNQTWQSLKQKNSELTPYCLRHGYAWRSVKYYPKPVPLRDTAWMMGHDLRTHIRHYGQWTDMASTKIAVDAAIKSLKVIT